MKKILILGSNGFVAKHLKKLLEIKSCEYLTLGRMNLDLTNFKQCKDILSKINLKDITIVFLSAIRPSSGEDLDDTIKSLSMIRNLVVNINTNLIRQFVYVSSDGVYPYSKYILTEKSETNPSSFYGHMHLLREKFLQNNISKDKLTILRPCAIYGDGETIFSYGVNRFMRDAIKEGKIYLFGKGEEKKDHIFVNDFVELIYKSYEKNLTGLFNVATGKSESFFNIANQINDLFNRKIKIVYVARKIEICHRQFNTNKLKKEFKLLKLKSINEGLNDLYKSYKVKKIK